MTTPRSSSRVHLFRILGGTALTLLAIFLMVGLPYLMAGYYNWEGDRLGSKGDWRAAEKAYQKALKAHPSPDTLVRLAHTLVKAHRPRTAVAALQTAIRMAPQDPDTHYALGATLMTQGDLTTAKQELSQAVTLNAADGAAHLALSSLASREGDQTTANHELELAVENGADAPGAHLHLAEIYLARGDRRAEAELRAAVASDPTDAAAHLRLGFVLLEKDPAEATSQLQLALTDGSLSPADRARALTAAALLAYRRSDLTEAHRDLDAAAALHPDPSVLAAVQYGVGIIRRDTSNLPGALSAFAAAAEARPGLAVLQPGEMLTKLSLYGAALDAERDGRLREADQNLKKLVELYPSDAEYRMQIGSVQLAEGDTQGALKAFRTAAGLASRDPEPWMRLSDALFRENRAPESYAALSHALRLAPLWTTIRPDVDVLMGKLDLALNKPQAAELCFQFAANSRSPVVNRDECLALLETATQRLQQIAEAAQPAASPSAPAAVLQREAAGAGPTPGTVISALSSVPAGAGPAPLDAKLAPSLTVVRSAPLPIPVQAAPTVSLRERRVASRPSPSGGVRAIRADQPRPVSSSQPVRIPVIPPAAGAAPATAPTEPAPGPPSPATTPSGSPTAPPAPDSGTSSAPSPAAPAGSPAGAPAAASSTPPAGAG